MVKIINIGEKYDGARLNRFFLKEFPGLTKSNLEKLLRKGQIRVNKGRVKSSFELSSGDEVKGPEFLNDFVEARENKISFDEKTMKEFKDSIIYQDESLLVVNKPSGLASQKSKFAKVALDEIAKAHDENLKLLHRLDKETSGLVMFARNLKAAKKFSEFFRESSIHKTYVACVSGTMPQESGQIKSFLYEDEKTGKQASKSDISGIRREDRPKYKRSLTEFEVKDVVAGKLAFVELHPLTGRKHQLRVHMSDLECPILGDKKYSDINVKDFSEELRFNIPENMFLHAWKVEFFHPILRKNVKLKADFPSHFKKLMKHFDTSF
ncbi:MAG: RluA family pseudouridine synthase [Alphaproteobacteria bacterium]|jgi:23S rRNA pseudouridine955/2504/2580 synthase|nr:RluA family pseudouridine synthase [Alphaproteobacteria bacterium]